jgi:hypothetical protein
MKFSGKMRETGTSTPISGGKTDEWVNWHSFNILFSAVLLEFCTRLYFRAVAD